jgi:non-specific serine/threonine protein kinase
LVTLTGVGGCGKTRLAIEAAAGLDTEFPDGVGFIDLASVREPAAVAEALAVGLGLRQQQVGQLADIIADTRPLLVLDNAEHQVEAVSALARDLLAHCPNLVILVTSREPLHVEGEACWEVPPLAYPAEGVRTDVATVSSYEAVQLFTARTAESFAGFTLTPESVALVAVICRQLDGIPLAIELAAARVRSHGLAQVAARLEDALRLLTRGSRAGPARHRTLRATFDWSHQLLDEPGRVLFRRLSVFAGFDVAAAEAICSGPDLPAADVADILHDLVDRSLVVPQPQEDGSLRYRQYEVIRQYAREKLLEAGEPTVTLPFAEYYGNFARHLEADRGDLRTRAARMAADYGNVQMAIDWAATSRPGLAAAIVSDLWWFWSFGGAVREPRMLIDFVLEKESVSARVRGWLYLMAAKYAVQDGDRDRAVAEVDRAEKMASEIADDHLAVLTLNLRGILEGESDPISSEMTFRRAIELSYNLPPTDHGPDMSQALSMLLNNLSMTLLIAGRAKEALIEIERAMDLMLQEPGLPNINIDALHTRGAALLALNHIDEARDQFISSLRISVENSNSERAVGAVLGLACIASQSGHHAMCVTLLEAARRWSHARYFAPHIRRVTPYDEAELRSTLVLGERATEAASQRGRALDIQGALDLAQTVHDRSPVLPLPPRKLQIVQLVAEGLTNKEIANRLSISERTVDAHLEHVRKNLGLRNRAQVAAWAVTSAPGALGNSRARG